MTLTLQELEKTYRDALEVQKIHGGLSGRFFKELKKEIKAKKKEKNSKVIIEALETDKEDEVKLHAV